MKDKKSNIWKKISRKNKWEVPDLSTTSSNELKKKSNVIEFLHNFKNKKDDRPINNEEEKKSQVKKNKQPYSSDSSSKEFSSYGEKRETTTKKKERFTKPSSEKQNTEYRDKLRQKWENGKKVILGPFGVEEVSDKKEETNNNFETSRDFERSNTSEEKDSYHISKSFDHEDNMEQDDREDKPIRNKFSWKPDQSIIQVGEKKEIKLSDEENNLENSINEDREVFSWRDENQESDFDLEEEISEEPNDEDELDLVDDEEETEDDLPLDDLESEDYTSTLDSDMIEDEFEVNEEVDEDTETDLNTSTIDDLEETNDEEFEDIEDEEEDFQEEEGFEDVEEDVDLEEDATTEEFQTDTVELEEEPRELFLGYEKPGMELLDDLIVSENEELRKEEVASHIKNVEEVISIMNLPIHIGEVEIGSRIVKLKCPIRQAEFNPNKTKNEFTSRVIQQIGDENIRFQLPLPGHSNTYGIEIPLTRSPIDVVQMRKVMTEIENSESSSKKIIFPLGLDANGNYPIGDFEKLVHCLVAGYTGSGKSVFLQSIILTFLLRTSPADLKLVLIDPKHVEFSKYEEIPHLLAPVVTEAVEAGLVLNQMVEEMETRYRLFKAKKVKNITAYNETMEIEDRIPYIVIIIDELAELLMTDIKDVAKTIGRIAQKARAAGIHLIVATQRPSADVVDSHIKANLSTRIAFSLSTSIDSRTILDSGGAELLLGKGDMLIKPAGEHNMERVQGVFASEGEIERIVEWTCSQAKPDFDESFMNLETKQYKEQLEKVTDNNKEKISPKYVEAVELIIERYDISKKVSISGLQRGVSIAHVTAGRIVDELTKRGLLSQDTGQNKPREVIAPKESFEELLEEWKSKVN